MSTIRTTKGSRKYAKALFELLKAEEIEPTNAALTTVAELITPKSELLAALSDPRYTLNDRYTVIQTVLSKSGITSIKVVNLIKTLTESRHLSELSAIAAYFDLLVQALKKSLHIEVTSAFPLNPQDLETLKASVAKQYAGLSTITTELDKELIGGMQIKLGDKVFDNSVKGSLEKIGAALAAG